MQDNIGICLTSAATESLRGLLLLRLLLLDSRLPLESRRLSSRSSAVDDLAMLRPSAVKGFTNLFTKSSVVVCSSVSKIRPACFSAHATKASPRTTRAHTPSGSGHALVTLVRELLLRLLLVLFFLLLLVRLFRLLLVLFFRLLSLDDIAPTGVGIAD
jgi:hypothetical protein